MIKVDNVDILFYFAGNNATLSVDITPCPELPCTFGENVTATVKVNFKASKLVKSFLFSMSICIFFFAKFLKLKNPSNAELIP